VFTVLEAAEEALEFAS